MRRTGAWRGACAAGSVTSIRVGSSAWLGSVVLFIMVASLRNLNDVPLDAIN